MSAVEVLVVVAVVLFGVLVGAVIPTLLQARRTLRAAERFLDTTGRKLDRTLNDASVAATGVRRLVGELEAGVGHVRDAVKSASELSASLGKLRDAVHTTTRLVNALGPAVVAAVHAFVNARAATAAAPPDAGAPGPERTDSGLRAEPHPETDSEVMTR